MLLIIIRAIFIFVVAGMGVRTARCVGEKELANPYPVFVGIMLAAIVVVVGDLITPW